MPRIARAVAVGIPHHITQRGNFKQAVFFDEESKLEYLSLIRHYSSEYGLTILAYCLMDNHVHLIATPLAENSLAKVFHTVHMLYSQLVNKKFGRCGHLWQGRFFSCPLDEPHLLLTARYVERNPVRAGLVIKPWEWKWSSASAHIQSRKDVLGDLDLLLELIDMSAFSWKRYIDSPDDDRALSLIRAQTLNGRPLGSQDFLKELEDRLNRKLKAEPKGRPYKQAGTN